MRAIRLASALAIGAACAAAGWAQGAATGERITFAVEGAHERGAAVVGDLRIPASERVRLPAVVIVNSSPGFDGRSAFYAEALNAAGIATFEVDFAQGRGLPASARFHLPHAFGSLRFLARHPRIDADRIGIMGFSWGGIVAVLSSSTALGDEYAGGERRFAAHLGLYPICWRSLEVLEGKSRLLDASVYARLTGSPVHILVGERDGYDAPDGCQRFVAALPAPSRSRFGLTVLPGATFAWDSRFGSAVYEAGARQGKGGIVTVDADPSLARQSRDFAIGYFGDHLRAR